MRKVILLLAWICGALQLSAAPVYPFPVTVIQSDGTALTIIGHGDEHFHYITTTDGVLLVQEGRDYFIGKVNETGELVSTRQLAHDASLRSVSEKQLAAAQNHDLFLSQAELNLRHRAPLREPISQTGTLFPHVGNPKAVVILVEFADTTFSIPNPRASFEQYLNCMTREMVDYGAGDDSNISSVRDYFKTMSNGLFEPQFDLYGPVKLSKPLKSYGGTKPHGVGEDIHSLVNEACKLMDDSLDFSQYDANSDGNVDLVYVIYAGYSESITGNSNECIWPKSGTTSSEGTYDGKRISRYGLNNELNGFPNCWSQPPFKRINGIGLFCHEFSHCMGLPDFYPTEESSKGNNQGMEYWSLMDLGEYLKNGYFPTEYTAWERECFGWTEIEELDPSQTLDITTLSKGGKAYRITNEYDATKREYYILENIQKRGFNYEMKGHGLVVTHVNYEPTAFSLSGNRVNNEVGKPRMTVIPADGLLFCNKFVDNKTVFNSDFYAQLAGDPFPGTSDVRVLTEDSGLPNMALWVTQSSSQANNSTFRASPTGNAIERLCYTISNIREDEDGVIHLNEIPTGIREVPLTSSADGSIYTIDGRYVGKDLSKLQRGVYIINGKKIVRR